MPAPEVKNSRSNNERHRQRKKRRKIDRDKPNRVQKAIDILSEAGIENSEYIKKATSYSDGILAIYELFLRTSILKEALESGMSISQSSLSVFTDTLKPKLQSSSFWNELRPRQLVTLLKSPEKYNALLEILTSLNINDGNLINYILSAAISNHENFISSEEHNSQSIKLLIKLQENHLLKKLGEWQFESLLEKPEEYSKLLDKLTSKENKLSLKQRHDVLGAAISNHKNFTNPDYNAQYIKLLSSGVYHRNAMNYLLSEPQKMQALYKNREIYNKLLVEDVVTVNQLKVINKIDTVNHRIDFLRSNGLPITQDSTLTDILAKGNDDEIAPHLFLNENNRNLKYAVQFLTVIQQESEKRKETLAEYKKTSEKIKKDLDKCEHSLAENEIEIVNLQRSLAYDKEKLLQKNTELTIKLTELYHEQFLLTNDYESENNRNINSYELDLEKIKKDIDECENSLAEHKKEIDSLSTSLRNTELSHRRHDNTKLKKQYQKLKKQYENVIKTKAAASDVFNSDIIINMAVSNENFGNLLTGIWLYSDNPEDRLDAMMSLISLAETEKFKIWLDHLNTSSKIDDNKPKYVYDNWLSNFPLEEIKEEKKTDQQITVKYKNTAHASSYKKCKQILHKFDMATSENLSTAFKNPEIYENYLKSIHEGSKEFHNRLWGSAVQPMSYMDHQDELPRSLIEYMMNDPNQYKNRKDQASILKLFKLYCETLQKAENGEFKVGKSHAVRSWLTDPSERLFTNSSDESYYLPKGASTILNELTGEDNCFKVPQNPSKTLEKLIKLCDEKKTNKFIVNTRKSSTRNAYKGLYNMFSTKDGEVKNSSHTSLSSC